jgi:hypothetical protein
MEQFIVFKCWNCLKAHSYPQRLNLLRQFWRFNFCLLLIVAFKLIAGKAVFNSKEMKQHDELYASDSLVI